MNGNPPIRLLHTHPTMTPHTHHTHPVPPRHQPQIRQHGTHRGRNKDLHGVHTTGIEAPGQPWCDTGVGGGGWGPGCFSSAGGLPGASIAAVGAVLLLLLSLVSGYSLMLFVGCTWGCWVQCVALFLPPRCALGASCRCLLWALFVCFRSVLLVRARGPALRLGVCLWGFPLLFVMCYNMCYKETQEWEQV